LPVSCEYLPNRSDPNRTFILGLPHGYDTKVGEHGVMLSGGQRQRIAIARALVTNPRLLILDEATSQLDYESEYVIQRNLARICAGRTVFIIAHRLSAVAVAHHILVIDRGVVVEQGTFGGPLRQGGYFARLHAFQARSEATAALDSAGPAVGAAAGAAPGARAGVSAGRAGDSGATAGAARPDRRAGHLRAVRGWGQQLLVIVPASRPLVVEAYLENKDVGFVQAGQHVEVKPDAFPYTRYGTIPGTVTDVSRDAVPLDKNTLAYAVHVAIARDTVSSGSETVRLSPGTTVVADIDRPPAADRVHPEPVAAVRAGERARVAR